MGRSIRVMFVAAFAGVLAGCVSVSGNAYGKVGRAETARIFVCHGYDCTYRTRLDLGPADAARFAAMLRRGHGSAAAERKAISDAVRHFERRAGGVIGISDKPKGTMGDSRAKGQMDCIDESTNTRALLVYLETRELLKHHAVEYNRSRGFFADGRYPHSTAVVRDEAGTRWTVDSWYEPMGGAPDIMPLERWMSRGVLGER